MELGKSRGYGDALDCANCHRPTADGVRFPPGRHGTRLRSLPQPRYDRGRQHRAPAPPRRFRSDGGGLACRAGRSPSAPLGLGLSGRKRPGGAEAAGLYRADFGSPALASLAAHAGSFKHRHLRRMSRHRPTAAGNVAQWRVQPVHQTARYFLHGWFDHKAHEQTDCADCHGAAKSDKASDLMLPGVESCRTCHQGEGAVKAKVPSSCIMCHDYHPDPGAPWAVRNERRGQDDVHGRAGAPALARRRRKPVPAREERGGVSP